MGKLCLWQATEIWCVFFFNKVLVTKATQDLHGALHEPIFVFYMDVNSQEIFVLIVSIPITTRVLDLSFILLY